MSRHDQIVSILRKITKSDASPSPEESLFESGLLDSFALPDMVAELEREFGIQVPDSDLVPRKFESIAKIDSYVAARQ